MYKTNNKQSVLLTIFILGLVFMAISTVAHATSDSAELKKIINHKINKAQTGVGVAVALVDGDKTEFHHFGLSQKDKGLMVDENTLFEIGSITKTFTATALASMVSEGKLKLDDPVQPHLPQDVTLPIKNDKPITFRMLANHTSGLPRLPSNMPFSNKADPYADYSVELMYAFLNSHQLAREAGEKAEYSNLGAGLLGHVLSLIDNKPYEEVIRTRVLEPLNMNSTFVDVPTSYLSKLSDGHNELLKKTSHWDLGALDGAGALKSSIKDMAHYLRTNIDRKKLNETLTLAHSMPTDADESANSFGLSWIHNQNAERTLMMHDGGTGGFRSFIAFDQAARKGIVILTNTAFDMNDVGYHYLMGSLDLIELVTVEEVELTDKQLSKLNGKFELVPGFVLSITNENGRLYVQATGQPRLPLTATSATEFVNQAVKAKVVFVVDAEGAAQSLTLYQGGQTLPGRKL